MFKPNINRQNRQDNQKIIQSTSPSLQSSSTNEPFDFLELRFEPQKIFKYLITIISCLVTLNLIGIFLKHSLNIKRADDNFFNLIQTFSLDAESSLPSIYSSFTLLLCSVLLAIIAKYKYQETNRYRLHWKFLALIFLYLAIDEGAAIHELSLEKTRSAFNASGFFYFAWVIPAIVLFSLFVLIYLKFTLSLPRKTRFLFILCAATFVGGAIGIEMIGGQIKTMALSGSFIYDLTTTVEETLEMVAIAAFIYTLTDYLKKYVKPVIIRS